MKPVIVLLSFVAMSASVFADVWQKPPYIPDENHIPLEEIQREQAQEKRQAQEARHEKDKEDKVKKKESGSKGKIPSTDP